MRLKTKFKAVLVLAALLVAPGAFGAVGGAVSGTTGRGGSGTAVTTNTDQFLGVPLSIKSGVKITNAVVRASTDESIPITIYGASGQDADLLRIYDSASNVLGGFIYDGSLEGPGGGGPKFAVSGTVGQVWAETGSGIGAWTTPDYSLAVSGGTLVGSNMWYTGSVARVFTNFFAYTGGSGVTNLMITDLPEGKPVRVYYWATNGVTVNHPQSVASDYLPDGAVVTPNTNCWSYTEWIRRGTKTNITVGTAGFDIVFGNGVEANTNYATRKITLQYNVRSTNYATGALTVNCSTDVRAQITNAVASNYAITLATPVVGTAGSLSLVSDASARTLAILCNSAAITFMSTNWTASSTNVLTSASRRTLFAWRVGTATDGATTNIACWVVNQTP
jgi:hypothetical protein